MRSNKASATAHLIAASTVFLSKDPRFHPLIPTASAESSSWFIEEYSVWGRLLLSLITKSWFRPLIWKIEQRGVPGFMAHVALRKKLLERTVRDCLVKGYEQVVVLGAGFDTLAFRLHLEHPDKTFFEVDYPTTQEIKIKTLKKRNVLNDNFNFVAVDFTHENWTDRVSHAPNFKRQQPTVFIIEGVLMYLSEQEVCETLSFVAGDGHGKSTVAFTFMEMQPDGSISFRGASAAVDGWLKAKKEVFRWGINPQNLSSFLGSIGLTLKELQRTNNLRSTYLREQGLAEIPLAEGEVICVAEAK